MYQQLILGHDKRFKMGETIGRLPPVLGTGDIDSFAHSFLNIKKSVQ